MNEEAKFIAAIGTAPKDDSVRLAYASWLEGRCDVRGEYLRLEHELSQMPITLRLTQLREQIDPDWIALVTREVPKTSWYSERLTQRIVDGKAIPGVSFPAFIHNGSYFLTRVDAFKDRVIDCWGLVRFEDFEEKVRDGWVVTSIPEGAFVDIHNVARFTVSGVCVMGPEEEFVKDVANAIEELNGRPTAQERLIKAIVELRKEDTLELRKEFRRAYADLPAYYRHFIFGSRMQKHKDLQALLDGEA